jgi:hypothetical protein
MSREVNRERKSGSDVARYRAAVRDTMPALVTLVVVQGSLVLLDPDGGASGWNLLWSVLPLVPALRLVWAQLRSLRRADEYQRIVQLEAMAIGFGTVIVLSLAGGLLDGAGIGDPRQSLQVTFILGILAWIAALAIKTWQAR